MGNKTEFEKLRYLTNRGFYKLKRASKELSKNVDFSLIDTESETYIHSEVGSPHSYSAALYFNKKTGEYLELVAYVDLQNLYLVEGYWIYQPVEVKWDGRTFIIGIDFNHSNNGCCAGDCFPSHSIYLEKNIMEIGEDNYG